MRNEVEILKRCQNLHIVRMVDFLEQDKEGLLCIVLEYCNGGNLKDHVEKQKGGCLTEKESLGILEQIIDGFKVIFVDNADPLRTQLLAQRLQGRKHPAA